MDSTLAAIFDLYTLSTGRRLFALQQTQARAEEHGHPKLKEHCALAIEHDQGTRDLEVRWTRAASAVKSTPALQRIDIRVDRTLTAIRDTAMAQAEGAEPGDDIGAIAERLVSILFPTGVQAITSLPYVEELSAVDKIVIELKGPSAGLVEDLGLKRLTTRLSKLAVAYRAALEATPEPEIEFGKVRAARAWGQELVLEAVALIVGKHYTATDAAVRAALLEPILRQNEAVRGYLRARRQVQDVDPKTGEIDPAAPAGDQPVAGAGDAGRTK